jgi:hypothetical protein
MGGSAAEKNSEDIANYKSEPMGSVGQCFKVAPKDKTISVEQALTYLKLRNDL